MYCSRRGSFFVVRSFIARAFSASGMAPASHQDVASEPNGCRVLIAQGSNPGAPAAKAMRGGLEAHCFGAPGQLVRPCVDCGLITGCFCDSCIAEDRLPDEAWAAGQATPLCTDCDRVFEECHFCRRQHWCAPKPHR